MYTFLRAQNVKETRENAVVHAARSVTHASVAVVWARGKRFAAANQGVNAVT